MAAPDAVFVFIKDTYKIFYNPSSVKLECNNYSSYTNILVIIINF